MLTLAIDAMGGDQAPAHIVDEAVAAVRHLDVRLLLVGDPAAIVARLALYGGPAALDVEVIDAPDVVGMAEAPAAALRARPRASIRVAAELVAEGRAAGLFSAGNTGATMLAARAACGMLPGVGRPALAPVIPTRGAPAVLLDAGANAAARPRHLVEFALMGAAYARVALGVAEPRVGLLSIGEEETKGNRLTREAHRLLKTAPVRFIGNVEGREVYSGVADVVVCDGFTGNVVLKTGEGLVDAVEALLGDELRGTFSSQVGYLLARRAFRRFRRRVDHSEYGGAPLLGVRGLALVGHGRSSARAVRNAIAMAARRAREGIVGRVRDGVAALEAGR
jgi:glycerol-3-phosphate acyltransferase PlsX